MAKPTVTNIRPPTTPPKTSWNLDNAADQNDPYYASLDTNPSGFDSLLAKLNLTDTGLTSSVLHTYDYVFFGVNGGMDETVVGRQEHSGIIVTGNGKDNVTGGNWDDIVMSGNGADVVHGGKGDDIIFAENGPDQAFGDADNDQIFGGNGPDKIIGGTDNGDFSATAGSLALKDGKKAYVGTLADLPNNLDIKTGPADQLHNTSPPSYILEAGKLYEVLEIKLTDVAPVGATDHALNIPVTVAVYKGGVGAATIDDLLDIYTTELDDGYVTQLAVEIKNNADYANAKVYVFLNHLDKNNSIDALKLNDPEDSAQTNARPLSNFDAVVDQTEDSFTFVAGDILTGGNSTASLLPAGGLSTTNVYDPNFKVGISDGSPDTFIYNKVGSVYDGVDLITDYSKIDGDVIELHGIAPASVRYFEETVDGQNNLIIAFDNGSGGLVNDAAIKVLGAQHASDVSLLFT
ncbi:MAG: hypothetical protein A4S14_17560 [Proteobacteria bacterium SG_bin9]|nr:MAG: hypothetical protein A4S14_17560 [Proteobacteria bacterium SG_bin9]